ncbi:DUF4129 domain-containing protein [Hymenobacter sediminicola]|uniref:DUF4129 domain-containing protein n=1 Tax=Hymenobacter sediminicola TaxID=2761579 RepID=A0A7G7WA90_9BACT|nr:DUF4129 domain-containing protein [Hymenobacter sediminicola]QNH63283.1 DUF4129 domain-containing protein [Hymenobacter sediminicola]
MFLVLLFRRCRVAVLLVLVALAAMPAAAQRPRNAAATYPLPPDRTTPVTLRRPAPERLREFRQQREFQYVEVKSEQSSWDLLWARFWHWLSDLLETRPGKLVWKYGICVGLVVALVYVVLKLMQVDLTRAFGRSPRPVALAYDVQAEDIHGQDFEALLAAAEAENNYRLAVRLGYLHVLKQLADQSLIRWQPDKTNHDYLFELPAGPLPDAFRELTQQFDYVWYGEHDDLTPAHYAQARATRLAFQQLLHTGRRAA